MKSLKALALLCLTSAPIFADAEITVTPLGAIKKDAVGLLPPSVSGISADFWGDAAPQTVARSFPTYRVGVLPAVNDLAMRIALAEVSAPAGTTSKAQVLTARLDYLISAGALDQADALLSTVGVDEPSLFDRWFAINAITGKFARACRPLIKAANLAALPERAFCLAQNGDWKTAEVTLSMGDTLGAIEPNISALLHRFLDRELFEDIAIPTPSQNPTPLEFVLRSEMDLPRAGQMTLAEQNYVLTSNVGWKARLLASEGLTRSGALPPSFLLSVYQEAKPSASGGVWDRVAALQQLMSNLETDAAGSAMAKAYSTLSTVGLQTALADLVAEDVSPLELSVEYEPLQLNVALLHKDFDLLADPMKDRMETTDPRFALLIQDYTDMVATTPIENAIKAAFSDDVLTDQRRNLLDRNQIGTAVLLALSELSNGAGSDPKQIAAGLQTLIRAGFYTEAQKVALQLLILPTQAPG